MLLRHLQKYKNSTQNFTIQSLFKSRNLFHQSTSPQLASLNFLKQHQNCSAYCGYDPTASSLHLGNLVSILMMARLDMMGMKPVFLLGGASGMIGDPSGKNKERKLLDQNLVDSNLTSIQGQISKIYTNINQILTSNPQNYTKIQTPLSTPTFQNNANFYTSLSLLEFLRTIGKHFRLSTMLSREIISSRLQSQQGISYTQFSYQIIQAYDFYRLYLEKKCVLQIGGSDQWGNIVGGCQFVRKVAQGKVFGITMPLLVGKGGEKFGKSQGNALFLNQQKTPHSEIHNYLLNISDEEIRNYLYIFTFFTEDKIKEIMESHELDPSKRTAQETLSNQILTLLGGESINKIFFRLTHTQLITKQQQFFSKLFKHMSQQKNIYFKIEKPQGDKMVKFADFLIENKLCKSKSQFRRELQKGGFYINNERINGVQFSAKQFGEVQGKHILYDRYLILRWGKKRYQFIQLV